MSGGIQTQVNQTPAPGIAGDFASTNPRATYDAGPGGLVAGPGGLTVGLAAWTTDNYLDGDGAPASATNTGSGAIAGILHREQQGLNTIYLSDASMLVPQGFPVTLTIAGDLWVVNNGTTQAVPGQKAYANFSNGQFSFAAAGAPAGATSTSYTIAAGTSSFAGSINGDVLAVTGAVTGTIYPGTTISGSGVASGTKIVAQLSGTTGGAGTYIVNIPEQTVASTTISGTYGLLTLGGTITGVFGVGDSLSGTGVTAGSTITALGTGTGGAGTYIVDPTQTASSGTITAALNVETKWICRTSGLAGELVKISSWLQG